MKNLLISMVVLLSVSIISCKKDNTNSTNILPVTADTGTYKFVIPSNFTDTLIKLPKVLITKANTNDTLEILVNVVNIENIYGSWFPSYFDIVNLESRLGIGSTKKNANGSCTYTFLSDGSSISFTYNNSSTNPYYSYQVDSSGHSWTYFMYSASPTGGTSTWYSSAGILCASDAWTISIGSTISTFITYDADGITESSKWIFDSNSNLSGSCQIFTQINNLGSLVEQYTFTWTAAGIGNYTVFGTTNTIMGTF